MARRYLTDSTRATLSSLVTLPSTLALVAVAVLRDDERLTDAVAAQPFVSSYLPYWPTFTFVYLLWTHVTYARRSSAELREVAAREETSRRRWWNRWAAGTADAGSLTLFGAVAAVVVTISIAQVATLRANPLFVALGLLTVAASWALMVYSFALDYFRADTRLRVEGRSAIVFHVEDTEEEVRFGDYLTFAILASTMAATISADVRSRRIWKLVRLNVLVAFAFNSVVVAMVVSLLFGGLAG